MRTRRTKINYLYLQKRYGGQYVATYKGKVVVHARKASAFAKKFSKDPRRPHLVVQFVPPYKAICIYAISPPAKGNGPR